MIHKKNKLGITPVIALVMLMLVTVGIVGISYSWFSGLFSSQTKKAISIPPGGAYCSNGEIKVYALNSGDSAITTSDIIVAQVDGVDVKGTPFFGDMKSSLVGYWKFDETLGAVASDSSGNGNNGNLQPACPNCPAWTAGRSRNALSFDGVNDYVDAGSPANLNNMGKFTIMAWVIQKTNAWSYIAGKDYYADAGSFDLGWHNTCNSNNGGWWLSWNKLAVCFGDTLKDRWVHVAVTYDSDTDTFNMYQNGVPVKTTGATDFIINNPLAWHIGKSSSDPRYWNGLIDEVKIYNKANADVNIPPSGSGMVINYPVLEGKHTVKIGTSSGVAETTVTCG